MSRCADCAHFEPPEPLTEWEIEYRAERPNLKPGGDWGECVLTDNTFNEGSQPDTIAIAVDGSEYHAVLMVSPEFGCVQFATRETV